MFLSTALCPLPSALCPLPSALSSLTSFRHRTDNVIDRHRNVVFSCPKLQFYCNIKKTGPGKYDKLDKFTPR